MIPLTSQQQHCMATPRRGNRVHKLTANFRDPEQLYSAYSFRLLVQSLKPVATFIVDHNDKTTEDDKGKTCIVANDGTRLIRQQPATPADSAAL